MTGIVFPPSGFNRSLTLCGASRSNALQTSARQNIGSWLITWMRIFLPSNWKRAGVRLFDIFMSPYRLNKKSFHGRCSNTLQDGTTRFPLHAKAQKVKAKKMFSYFMSLGLVFPENCDHCNCCCNALTILLFSEKSSGFAKKELQ